MKVFFAGDFVDSNNEVSVPCLHKLLKEKEDILVLNLEGPILNKTQLKPNDNFKYNLFSTPLALKKFEKFNIVSSLANNHINDFKEGLNITTNYLAEKRVPYFGTTKKPYIEIKLGTKKYCVFAFNSDLTLPHSKRGVSTISKYNISLVDNYIKHNSDTIIVVYAHFGIELSKLPRPCDRLWCIEMSKIGVDYIIGHHPHIIQGVERFNKTKVFYSIGNFAIPQVDYLGKKLKYKDPNVSKGLVVEITSQDKFKIHSVEYKENDKKVTLGDEIDFDTLDIGKDIEYHKSYKEYFVKKTKTKFYYPTFDYYYGLNYKLKFGLINCVQVLRKILIQLGIHRPFK